MLESPEDVSRLDDVLDASYRDAGPQLKRIFGSARVSARELIDRLTGIFEIHLATLTATGAPVVSPIDALFLKGKVWTSLSGQSVRAKLVARDTRVSASYTDGSFGLVVHGTARLVDETDPYFQEVDDHVTSTYVAQYGEVWKSWRDHTQGEQGPGISAWIEPRVMFAKR